MVAPIVLLAAKMAADQALGQAAADNAAADNYMETRAAERRNKAPDLATGGGTSPAQELVDKFMDKKINEATEKRKQVAPPPPQPQPQVPPAAPQSPEMPPGPPPQPSSGGSLVPNPTPPPASTSGKPMSEQDIYNDFYGIPKYAGGGVVDKPTLAMLGDGGEPEIALPLSGVHEFVQAYNTRKSRGVFDDQPSNRRRYRLSTDEGAPSEISADSSGGGEYSPDSDPYGENTPNPEDPRNKRDYGGPVKRKGFWEKAAGLIGDSPLKSEIGASENPFINALVYGAHLYSKSKLSGADNEYTQRVEQRKNKLSAWDEEDKQYQRDLRSAASRRAAGRLARRRAEAEAERFNSTHVLGKDNKMHPVGALPTGGSGGSEGQNNPALEKIRARRRQIANDKKLLDRDESNIKRIIQGNKAKALSNGSPEMYQMYASGSPSEDDLSNDPQMQSIRIKRIVNNFNQKLFGTDNKDMNESDAQNYLRQVLDENKAYPHMRNRIVEALRKASEEYSNGQY
jgi:hypothetical protein